MKYLLLIAFVLISSCSSDKNKGKSEAEKLYLEAQELAESDRFILATEKLQQIKTEHPYSFFATPAELLLAEVQFKQESFPEAAASFLLFRDFHPKHEKIAYVVYMIGESYFMQLPSTIDRDLESGNEAIKFYEEIVAKYPNSEYVEKAKTQIDKIQKMLREKDQYIADFYYKTEVWEATRYWYIDILTHHADKVKLRQHSMLRVVASSCQMKKWEECLIYAEKFQTLVDKETAEEIRSWEKLCKRHETR
ncbi:MAG: outer membrane protein assembly factor BamD [Bacteriovoracaceae bacterium]|nr:outer membrane protein assembly factor BamD [Bacteriovoracaceae bacterium]